MREYVEVFTKQLEEALTIQAGVNYKPLNKISNVLILGLGGSGIGGTIVSELMFDNCPVPVNVSKDYDAPNYVNESTLVIISSYSGNTEETIEAMKICIAQKAQVICISSGGEVEKIATENGFTFIKVPGGNPPRACLTYSLTQLLGVFKFAGLSSLNFETEINNAIALINKEQESIHTEAKAIAKVLHNKITVIYALGHYDGLATRFRQQINENSKELCWHHIIPEMNHNELVGWTRHNNDLAVVVLRSAYDYSRSIKRLEICTPIFKQFASSVTEIMAKGNSRLEQLLYMINLTDWVSCYLADLKQVDATEVNVINHLKGELSKFH